MGRFLSDDEYSQLMQLKRLCEFWANISPSTSVSEDEHVLGLVKSTLGLIARNEDNQESQSEPEVEATEPEPQTHRTRAKNRFSKFEFDARTDLLGKTAPNHMAKLTNHFKANPYNIPIDVYVKCPRCDKVGVSNMKIDTNSEGGFTDVWQRFRHDGNVCFVRIDRIDEALSWDKVLARRLKYNKRHGLASYKYPETEQVPEVEEDEDQSTNEIEAETEAVA